MFELGQAVLVVNDYPMPSYAGKLGTVSKQPSENQNYYNVDFDGGPMLYFHETHLLPSDPALIAEYKAAAAVMAAAVKPLRISYAHGIDDYVNRFGGKAVSLGRLMSLSVNVPESWVIPCGFSLTRPPINLQPIKTWFDNYVNSYDKPSTRFAVRSGAPISMPGLLNTKLNVAVDDIPDAITAVWDSWNAEHAIAYREAKNISHDIGTAVIIQRMVNARYSGVAFTNDPNNWEFPEEFSPVIEWVEGFGDKLVGGEVTPSNEDLGTYWYEKLKQKLEGIHNQYGPSDVEWCYDGSVLWFVQQRALRFAAAPPEAVVQVNTDLGEVLQQGKAIGAPVVVTAKVTGDIKDFKPGYAVYAAEFTPEMYPVMVKASAILTAKGGATCHASIIARELNKPAISGVDWKSLPVNVPLTIDGSTGAIHRPVEGAAVVVAQEEAPVAVLDKTRKPDFRITEQHQDINNLLFRFYFTLENAMNGTITTQQKDCRVKEIASILCTYLYQACLGEMRHIRSKAYSGKGYPKRQPYLRVFRKYGVVFPNRNKGMSMDRSVFVGQLSQPPTLAAAIKIVQCTVNAYDELHWGSSFGGKAWGNIAKVLLAYLNGALSDTLFVDACFNLKHNGGQAYGKFDWITCDESILRKQLDAKLRSPKALRTYLTKLNTMGYTFNWDEECVIPKEIYGETKEKEAQNG